MQRLPNPVRRGISYTVAENDILKSVKIQYY